MTLSTDQVAALSAQYLHEITNSLIYRHLASWAEYRGLTGIAGWLRKQAAGELEHADKVIAYIEDRNEAVIPGGILPDFADPYNVQALFERVREIENLTTEKLAEIEAVGDPLTRAWIIPLMVEQIEEENAVQTIIDRIGQRIASTGLDGAAVHDLDVWIGGL